jgi:RNA polymerase sigma factor (sigma-70 family)
VSDSPLDDQRIQDLFEQHAEWLRERVMIIMRRSLSDAEDIVSDVFVALIERATMPDDEDKQRALLFGIAKKKNADLWRSAYSEMDVADAGVDRSIYANQHDQSEDWVDDCLHHEAVKYVLSEIGEEKRELLIKAYVLDKAGPELAEELQIEQGTFRKRLWKANQDAKALLRRKDLLRRIEMNQKRKGAEGDAS